MRPGLTIDLLTSPVPADSATDLLVTLRHPHPTGPHWFPAAMPSSHAGLQQTQIVTPSML